MEDQATNTMTRYPTQLHYPDIEPTSPSLILIMQGAWLGSDNDKSCKVIGLTRPAFERVDSNTQLMQPSRLISTK